MICPPCADAADQEAAVLAVSPHAIPGGHHPEVCRDFAIQPGGCPCQHRPVQREGAP